MLLMPSLTLHGLKVRVFGCDSRVSVEVEGERRKDHSSSGQVASRLEGGGVAALQLRRLAVPANQCHFQVLDGIEGPQLLYPGKSGVS